MITPVVVALCIHYARRLACRGGLNAVINHIVSVGVNLDYARVRVITAVMVALCIHYARRLACRWGLNAVVNYVVGTRVYGVGSRKFRVNLNFFAILANACPAARRLAGCGDFNPIAPIMPDAVTDNRIPDLPFVIIGNCRRYAYYKATVCRYHRSRCGGVGINCRYFVKTTIFCKRVFDILRVLVSMEGCRPVSKRICINHTLARNRRRFRRIDAVHLKFDASRLNYIGTRGQ